MPTHFYLLNISPPEQALLEKLVALLPRDIQIKATKSRFLRDQWRIILSDFLIRNILGTELSIPREKIEIKIDKYGKPFLSNKARHFNLSHSENVVVVATDDTPIGIDVEYVQPFDDLEHLLTQFSEEEQTAYDSKTKEERVDFFYDLWTLKESYIKALGKGLSCSLKSFSIKITENEPCLLQGIDSDLSWHFRRYQIGGNYKCAICAKHRHFPEKVKMVEMAELLKLYL